MSGELLRFSFMSHGPTLDEDGPFVLAADAEAHEDALVAKWVNYSAEARKQAIRDCIAAVEALAVADVDGVMWVGERLEHVLGSFPLATGGVISSDATPPLADGCVLPGVAAMRALLEEKP